MISDRDVERLNNAATALGEHFDTVLILVSSHDQETGTTSARYGGTGNIHARVGMARSYIMQTDMELAKAMHVNGEDE